MRLLHARDFYFEEFFDAEVPEYAILSHRWTRHEVSYQDFLVDNQSKEVKAKGVGYQKIQDCARMAVQYGLNWIWVDACCIDKKSSAELSEAINSMWKWYERASICFVFLKDVHPVTPVANAEAEGSKPAGDYGDFTVAKAVTERVRHYEDCVPFREQQLRESVWFTRGWTLQELLAPRRHVFYNSAIQPIGTKYFDNRETADENIWQLISDVCGIHYSYTVVFPIARASIAERMSWASGRRTTRAEDIAYCLLGLFDVNMPLIYGEGSKAFLRLQLELQKKSPDDSIFAWPKVERDGWAGLLAPSPASFASSSDVYAPRTRWQGQIPVMTPKGFEVVVKFPAALDIEAQDLTITFFLACQTIQKCLRIALILKKPSSTVMMTKEKTLLYPTTPDGVQVRLREVEQEIRLRPANTAGTVCHLVMHSKRTVVLGWKKGQSQPLILDSALPEHKPLFEAQSLYIPQDGL